MTADFGATAAAVVYGAGTVALFGVRSWRHRAATGRSGINVVAARRDPAARLAGTGFAAAVVAGLASPVLARLHLLPLLARPEDWTAGASVLVGALVTGAGLVTAVLSQEEMGTSWRIGVDDAERTDLVTDGVFAVARNPIFTGMVTVQAGTALMAPTWLSAAGVGLLVTAVQLQVRRVEEPYLARVHGEAYRAYAARTGRFWPGLGRLRQPGPTSRPVADVGGS